MEVILCRMCRCGLHACCDRTSVHLCASSLQNLAVSPDSYSLVSVSVERCSDPVFDGMGLAGSRVGPMPFYWSSCSVTFCLLLFSLSLLSFYGLVLWGWGLRTDKVLALSLSLALPTFFNNDNNFSPD